MSSCSEPVQKKTKNWGWCGSGTLSGKSRRTVASASNLKMVGQPRRTDCLSMCFAKWCYITSVCYMGYVPQKKKKRVPKDVAFLLVSLP